MTGFLGVQRQNYWSDQKWQLYAVTYYKVTQFSRKPFWVVQYKGELEKTESYMTQTTYIMFTR